MLGCEHAHTAHCCQQPAQGAPEPWDWGIQGSSSPQGRASSPRYSLRATGLGDAAAGAGVAMETQGCTGWEPGQGSGGGD